MREKINIISGIKEPDHSILDELILHRRYADIFAENFQAHSEHLLKNGNFTGSPDEVLSKSPFMKHERIIYWEYFYLYYSLGCPDLEDKAALLYMKTLLRIDAKANLPTEIGLLSHLNKRTLFINLRLWARKNPDYSGDLVSIISNALATLRMKKEGG
jgi:hypothetical protein